MDEEVLSGAWGRGYLQAPGSWVTYKNGRRGYGGELLTGAWVTQNNCITDKSNPNMGDNLLKAPPVEFPTQSFFCLLYTPAPLKIMCS